MMNVEDIKQLIRILHAEYGNKVIANESRAELWKVVLGHATYREAEMAVAMLLSEARAFPPSVGEINQQIIKNRKGSTEDWSSLWDQVLAASSRSAYYSVEESSRLPESARKAIGGAAGLRELAMSDNSSVAIIRAQFRQRLEAINHHSNVEETKQSLEKALPNVNVNIKTIG